MPRSKKDTLRIIDTKPEIRGGGTIRTQALTIAPPPTGQVAAPSNLTATAGGVVRSPVKPEAYVNLTWRAPAGVVPTYYDIEYGRSSEWDSVTKTFSNPQRVQAYQLYATLSLGLNTTYRIRVRSVYRNTTSTWTDTVQVTTVDDTTAPDPVTNLATNWNPITGDLTITWTNPTNVQFRDARVRIYSDATKTILYRTVFSNSGRYVYTYAQNMQDSTSGDTSLTITVDSRNWSASGTVYSTSVDTTATLTAPANVTGVQATVNGATGEVVFRWNAIASNITGYRIRVNNVDRNVSTNEYRYSLAQNIIDNGGGSPLTTIPYNIVAFNIFNQVSSAAATGTAAFTAPATPAGLTVNFNTVDCSFKWTAGTDVAGYRLEIDTNVRNLGFTNQYTYTLAQNALEHSNNPDHTLTYILTAYNAVGQSTSTASTNITSPAPNAPTAVTLTAYFNVLVANITGHVRLPTHNRYKYLFRKDGSDFITIYSAENIASTELNATGSYIVRVSAEDVFNRSSNTFDSATVSPDVLTLAELRSAAIYSDSVGTAVATLNSLKDDNRTSGGVGYALGATWKWTRFERSLLDRYETITAGLFSPTTNTQIYFSTSTDASTWQWWAGPLSSGKLISVASEAAAQTGAITIGTTYANTTRWDLPSIVEARYIRIHHRNTPSAYTIREFYPRRLVQSDDIEAESILAINIAASTITGDKIAANTITATNIAGNTITTQKLLVSGVGMSITDDPNTVDISAWSTLQYSGSQDTLSIVSDSNSPTGNALNIARAATGVTFTSTTSYFPIDSSKNYIARMWIRSVSGSPTTYLTIAFYDANKNALSGSSYPTGWSSTGDYHYWALTGGVPSTTWTEYTVSFGPNETPKIPSPAKYIRIGGFFNYNVAGTTRINRVIVAEKTTGSLIVDGTITATKIAANAITTSQLSATAIDGMTITGSTIRTGASGARVVLDSTGLTTYNSSNVVQIQATTGNSGQLWAGAGAIRLSSSGMFIKSTATSTENNIRWYADAPAYPSSDGDTITGINGFWTTGTTLNTFQDVYARKTVLTDTVRARLSAYNESDVLQGRVDVADSFVQITTSAAQRAHIDSNGFGIGLTPTARNNTTLQLANGIGFPATQVASSDANTLDDYEEGSWSPTYTTFEGALPSVSYSVNRVGRYVKIGSYVTAWFAIQTSAITAGTLSNQVMIGGLPFTTINVTRFYCTGALGAHQSFGVNFPSAIVANLNDTAAFLYYRDLADGATTTLKVSDLLTTGTGNLLYGIITYRV